MASSSPIFLSSIDCFIVFSYSKLISFFQFLNLVHRVFNFEKYSFVIKVAIEVIRAELLAIGKAMVGLLFINVEHNTVEIDPINFSETIKTVFLFRSLTSFLNDHYQFQKSSKIVHNRVFLLYILFLWFYHPWFRFLKNWISFQKRTANFY